MRTELTTAELLDVACGLLCGGRPDRYRTACWIPEAATESAVAELLGPRGLDGGRATMRSKLTCVHVAYAETKLPTRCAYRWARRPDAYRQHAYDRCPTHPESLQLIDLVDSLKAA